MRRRRTRQSAKETSKTPQPVLTAATATGLPQELLPPPGRASNVESSPSG